MDESNFGSAKSWSSVSESSSSSDSPSRSSSSSGSCYPVADFHVTIQVWEYDQGTGKTLIATFGVPGGYVVDVSYDDDSGIWYLWDGWIRIQITPVSDTGDFLISLSVQDGWDVVDDSEGTRDGVFSTNVHLSGGCNHWHGSISHVQDCVSRNVWADITFSQ
jgi:hypothetical protein